MGRRGAGPAARPRSLLRRIADRLAAHPARHPRVVRKIPAARGELSSIFLCVLRALCGEFSLCRWRRKRSPLRAQRKKRSRRDMGRRNPVSWSRGFPHQIRIACCARVPGRVRLRELRVISRYTREEMGRVWSEEGKFRRWLEVELAATETLAE